MRIYFSLVPPSEFNELSWAANIEDSLWNEAEAEHQSCPASPSAITHAALDEKVTSPSVSVGTRACFVSYWCPGLLRKSQLSIS